MEKVSISKDLLHAILIHAYVDGFGCGGTRQSFTDDSPEAEILDRLEEEFDQARLDKLFPGEFEIYESDEHKVQEFSR